MRISKRVQVPYPFGLNLRAASDLSRLCRRFKSDIKIQNFKSQTNGKSVLGLLALEAQAGTELDLIADGPDALQALATLTTLFKEPSTAAVAS